MRNTPLPDHPGSGRPRESRPSGPGTAFANFLIDYLPTIELTNEQIATELGYARPTIVSMWKSAKTKVTMDAIWPLSKLLKVDPVFLLALYFEQFSNGSGADPYTELVRMMGRVTTPDEWKLVEAVREARRYNSFPLKSKERVAVEKLFKVSDDVPEGLLKPQKVTVATGRPYQPPRPNMRIDEEGDDASRRDRRGAGGKVLKAGLSARSRS